MSVKYHISPKTGNPNKCTAKPGGCPFGGEQEHYGSPEEARAAYERSQGAAVATTTAEARQDARAASYPKHSDWTAYPANPTREELLSASAYAKQQNTMVAVGYSGAKSKKGFRLELDYDGSGDEWLTVETRTYTVALPTGEFMRVTYKAEVEAHFDGYWEFHPSLNAHYAFYETASACRSNETPHGGTLDYWDAGQEIIEAQDQRGLYHKAEPALAIRTGEKLMEGFSRPYSAARVARLNHSKRRIPKELLLSNHYLGSADANVRRALAGRKELPKEAHEKLATDPSSGVRGQLAYREDLSAATVKKLLEQNHHWTDKYGEATVRHHALAGPSMTPALMKSLAKNGDLQDLQALARNPKLSTEAKGLIEKRVAGLGVAMPWGRSFYRD